MYNSSWPEIRLLLSAFGGGGGGGVRGGGGGRGIVRNVGALDVLHAPTINGGTGVTGPQQILNLFLC